MKEKAAGVGQQIREVCFDLVYVEDWYFLHTTELTCESPIPYVRLSILNGAYISLNVEITTAILGD